MTANHPFIAKVKRLLISHLYRYQHLFSLYLSLFILSKTEVIAASTYLHSVVIPQYANHLDQQFESLKLKPEYSLCTDLHTRGKCSILLSIIYPSMDGLSFNQWDLSRLSIILTYIIGINLRHLGRLRNAVTEIGCRKEILIEIIAR